MNKSARRNNLIWFDCKKKRQVGSLANSLTTGYYVQDDTLIPTDYVNIMSIFFLTTNKCDVSPTLITSLLLICSIIAKNPPAYMYVHA